MDFISINPATGVEIARYAPDSAGTVEAVLASAAAAARTWAIEPIAARAALLERLAGLLEERADEYAALITSEMGKPVAEARGEVLKSAGAARHFAAHGAEYLKPQPVPGTPGRIVYQPLGPVFGIMPWNLPFWQVMRLFAPAAVAGNVVIIKHAPSVQGSARALAAAIHDAGAPQGVYSNLAVDVDVVARIIADPRIRAVTITGSTRAGRAVAEAAGAAGKKVVLELGGSDPFIVFDDADFEKAVTLGVTSRFVNNAQSCIAAKRFLVQRATFEKYARAFADAAGALVVGDPMDPATKLGPLAREDIFNGIRRQVADARAAGGTITTGGKPAGGPGYFFQPTVITGLDPNAPIAKEEFFGPVALMFPFDTEEEAIALANATDYGLGGAVFSADSEKASRVADRLESGVVFINDWVRSDARAPFGGTKGSGFGRELGEAGARELTNAKLVWTAG